jgi:hypothetical protein
MNQLYDYQQAAQKDLETIAPHLRTIRKWVKIYPRLEPFLFITQPHLVVDNTRKQKRLRPNNDPKPPEAA